MKTLVGIFATLLFISFFITPEGNFSPLVFLLSVAIRGYLLILCSKYLCHEEEANKTR